MRVEEAQASDAAWDEYVASHPEATGYHMMGWRLIIEQAFGDGAVYLVAKDDPDAIRGVLPMVFFASPIFGRFLISLPYVNYGGVLADTPIARVILLAAAENRARAVRAKFIELRHQAEMDLAWPMRQHKVSMRLDLPHEFDILWRSFPSKLRSQIRRAQKERMKVRFGGEEVLDDFYQVFSRNMRDLGTPVPTCKFFARALKQFNSDARIAVVFLKDCPVAAGFLYGFREMLEIPWAASDRRYNRLAPNMLLYNSVLEYACERKYRVFDFGRSSPNSGTYRFKQQWGAQPIQLHWHYWVSAGSPLPDLSPSNQKYKWAISLWRRTPLFLSRRIGPKLSRLVP